MMVVGQNVKARARARENFSRRRRREFRVYADERCVRGDGSCFPPPWTVKEGDTYFVVKDSGGQKPGYVYFDDPRSAAKPLTRAEVRRIATNIAKLTSNPRQRMGSNAVRRDKAKNPICWKHSC